MLILSIIIIKQLYNVLQTIRLKLKIFKKIRINTY